MTKPRTLGILLLVLFLGVVVAWWTSVSIREGPTAAHPGTSDPDAGLHASRDLSEPPVLPRAATGVRADQERSVVEPELAVAPHLLVTVLGPDGVPLSGIPVELRDRASLARAAFSWGVLSHEETGPAGEPARLDLGEPASDGSMEVDWQVGVALPFANAPIQRIANRPRSGSQVTLVLTRDLATWCRPLRVRVLDVEGRPVPNVTVTIELGRELSGTLRKWGGRSLTRAPDGIAEVPLDWMWTFVKRGRGLGWNLTAIVTTDSCFVVDPEFELDLGTAAPESIDLILPPSTWIVADVRGPGLGKVMYSWVVSGPEVAHGGTARGGLHADAGRTRLGPFGLGWEVRATIADSRPGGRVVERTWVTPRTAGEVLYETVDLPAAPERLDLSATLSLPEGARWVGRRVFGQLRVPGSDRPWTQDLLEPNSDGLVRWSVGLGPDAVSDLELGVLELRVSSDPAFGERFAREAIVAVPRSMPSTGAWDFGSLQLEPVGVEDTTPEGDAVLVGRVVDEVGRPLDAAHVILRGTGPDGQPLSTGVTGARTNPAGEFAFEGLPDIEFSYWLYAIKSGYLPSSMRGAIEDLAARDIVLSTAGSIAGLVVVDSTIPLDRLEVLVDGGVATSLEYGSGHFRLEGLAPGLQTLTIQLKGSEWLVAELQDVLVEAGRSSADPRLQNIDLRGAVRHLRLELVESSGPLRLWDVRVYGDSNRHSEDAQTDPRGLFTALVPSSLEQFSVHPSGYGSVTVPWRAERQTLFVERE